MAAHRCSSFAQQQLEKHGWKTGQGLGRTESGISEAIKVKIKHDTAGVGHDLGEEFTYHWWDHVFNKAASNIVVENDQDGVKLSRKDESQGLISNKKLSKDRGKKPLLYGNFVKSATLTPAGLQHESNDASSSHSEDDGGGLDDTNIDDRFFKACGGRTAHKGARHGLNLSGKLKRIQAQEDSHMPQPPTDMNTRSSYSTLGDNGAHHDVPLHEDAVVNERKRGKKRRKKDKKCKLDERSIDSDSTTGIDTPDITDGTTIVNGEKDCKKRNKKHRKMKPVGNGDLNHEYSTDDVMRNPGSSRDKADSVEKKRHKRKKIVENGTVNNYEYPTEGSEPWESVLSEMSHSKAARKKAKKDKRTREKYTQGTERCCSNDYVKGYHFDKSKRKKKRSRVADVPDELVGDCHENTDTLKKSKKKKSRHTAL